MAAIITTAHFGNPDTEKFVIARIREFMAQYPGAWRIELLGAAHNTIWEMTVTAPDGVKQWVNKLYGEYDGQRIEKILADLQNMVERSKEDAKSAAHIA